MSYKARFQILFTDRNRVECFTVAERALFNARVKQLTREGISFTTWVAS